MFEKGSYVKQSNIKETKYGPQCAFSVKDHVQTAHNLDMDFVFQDGLFDNSFKQLYALIAMQEYCFKDFLVCFL